MNSETHQKVMPKIKLSMIPVRLLTLLIIVYFSKLGILPTYPGLITGGAFLIETMLRTFFTNSYASQNFQSLYLSLSPIWMLYFDPCSIVSTQILTVVNTRELALGETRKKYRTFYLLLTTCSWLLIILFGKSFLEECPHTITSNLRGDSAIILSTMYLGYSSIKRQVNSILCELKESLTEVKGLNSKLEVLNRDLKQSLEDKDNFILLFSHETRNPLNILIGNLTLLLGEVENIQYKSKLERCKFCADLLLQQLNNILDSGKLANKGTLELSSAPVNVNDYIQSISSFMEMLIKRKDTIKSKLIVPESLPKTLKFDMQRVTQVGLNLLTNSVKFTKIGCISMVIKYLRKESLQESDYFPSTDFGYRILSSSLRKEQSFDIPSESVDEVNNDTQIGYKKQFIKEIADLKSKKKTFMNINTPEKGFLKIEVNDTGCGIKPGDMSKLFKRFSQVHSDATQLQIGSGLGLWITKTLCELMGGDVRVYSVPEIGSCFVAIIQADCLPASRPISVCSQPIPLLDANCLPQLCQKRILLVDDDPFNVEFHTQIIRTLGCNSIETANDGQKLFDQFKKRPEGYFELIVTDISMPVLDGIGAAKLVRQFEEEQRRQTRVKIGFITGHSNTKDKLICEKSPLNCLFYLSKPIKPAILESFISSFANTSFVSINQESNSQRKIVHSNNPTKSVHQNNLIPQTIRFHSPLILCIDDDNFHLDFLEDMIKSLGARTIKAHSCEESLTLMKLAVSESIKEKIPNLVLINCRLPQMDGWTTSKMMKEILKSKFSTNVPIIGISGDDKQQNQEKLKISEMDGILQKPVQKEELKDLLLKYL